MLKKVLSLILCLVLCTGAAVLPASAEKITRIQEAVAAGGVDALWETVNTRYSADMYREEGCAELYIWQPDGPAVPARYREDWPITAYYTVAFQETAGIGFSLEKIVIYTIRADGTYEEEDAGGSILPNGPVHIDPYCGIYVRSSVPVLRYGRYRIIAAAGTDDNGHEQEFYAVTQLMNSQPQAAPEDSDPGDPGYDTNILDYDARFEVPVDRNVWWVPVNTLGSTRYTNREIAGMVESSPEEKQEKISTLYEAIQLFQISNFTYSEDNVRIPEGEQSYWEHHKPGRDAVRTNTGCCAADSNWLNYILAGDYEQVGFFDWSYPDGNGHVINYIYQDGWYYFLDLMTYEAEYVLNAAPETGSIITYRNSAQAAAGLHKVKNPEDYVKYRLRNDTPALFFLYQAENVLPIDGWEEDGRQLIIYPEGYDIRVMEGLNPETLEVRYAPGPEKSYRWENLKNAKIKARAWFLTPTDDPAEPLTAYQAGDVLTLEDNSGKGLAVIDGIRYSTSKKEEISLGFERSLTLYGEESNGVFNLRLPMGLHGEAMKEMNSLVLGELTADLYRKIPEVQMILCVREGDRLVVQEVMNGKYYDTRQISIRKDADGNWAGSEYWYLLITKDRKTEYRFGRFFCEVTDET